MKNNLKNNQFKHILKNNQKNKIKIILKILILIYKILNQNKKILYNQNKFKKKIQNKNY